MSSLFLSPHNDDEALFGAYIIQTYKPLVLVATDSVIQFERGTGITAAHRIEETCLAMEILDARVDFLHIPDNKITEENLADALEGCHVFDEIFAPALEGGNAIHDMVCRVADRMHSRVRHYSTYTKTREYPQGDFLVPATEEMKALKLRALECYKSQSNLGSTRQYFTTPHKEEYLCTMRCSG